MLLTGEHLTHDEFAEYLYLLLGKDVIEKIERSKNKEVQIVTEDNEADERSVFDHPIDFIPQQISFKYFINDLLGLDVQI